MITPSSICETRFDHVLLAAATAENFRLQVQDLAAPRVFDAIGGFDVTGNLHQQVVTGFMIFSLRTGAGPKARVRAVLGFDFFLSMAPGAPCESGSHQHWRPRAIFVFLAKLGFQRFHAGSYFCRLRLRSRTPAPPPFSAMNSTPAISKARRITSSVARTRIAALFKLADCHHANSSFLG